MKAIIFDCDGTLVDSEFAHYQAWNYALKKRGHDFSIEEYCEYAGSPSANTSKLLAKKIGLNVAEELANDKHDYFRSLLVKGISPIEDTLTFLHQLEKEREHFKYKLAIASGASREEILIYLHHLKIDHLFDVIISGLNDLGHYTDPEGINKPKPYIYIEATKQLGAAPSECIAIEDSHIGVIASSCAGCITVAVPTSYSQAQDFSAAHILTSTLKNYTVQKLLDTAKSIRSQQY